MKVLRAGLFVVISFAVLAHGAVEPWARAVLESASGLLLVWWALDFLRAGAEREMVLPSLVFPLAALALVVSAQWLFHWTASGFSTRNELELTLSM